MEAGAGAYLKRELTKIACSVYDGEDNIAKLAMLWKKPWAIELCKRKQFPTISFFEQYQEELLPYGVFVNQKGLKLYNRDVTLVNSDATIEFSMPEKTYTVFLYGNSNCVIKAENYAVVKIYRIGAKNSVIHKMSDKTSTILLD